MELNISIDIRCNFLYYYFISYQYIISHILYISIHTFNYYKLLPNCLLLHFYFCIYLLALNFLFFSYQIEFICLFILVSDSLYQSVSHIFFPYFLASRGRVTIYLLTFSLTVTQILWWIVNDLFLVSGCVVVSWLKAKCRDGIVSWATLWFLLF